MFYNDLENEQLPQWIFVTPDLYNDGHDTNISVSCNFTRSFVEPLLNNTYFNDNTLVYITWQANGENATARNQVAGILLGSALPDNLVGTKDNNFYNHYSEMSSVQANVRRLVVETLKILLTCTSISVGPPPSWTLGRWRERVALGRPEDRRRHPKMEPFHCW
jgi:hypothetical protein